MKASTSYEPEDNTATGLRNRIILLPLYHLVNQHYEQHLEPPEPALKQVILKEPDFKAFCPKNLVSGLQAGFSNLSPA